MQRTGLRRTVRLKDHPLRGRKCASMALESLDVIAGRHIVRVVVASPGDVKPEGDIAVRVIEELNRTTTADRGLLLEAVRWETDAYAGFHLEGPQGICDDVFKIEIVGSKMVKDDSFGISLNGVPDYVGFHSIILLGAVLRDSPEHLTFLHSRATEPSINQRFTSDRHRNRSQSSSLPRHIDDHPVILPRLQLIQS
jgi:hypothetical protein